MTNTPAKKVRISKAGTISVRASADLQDRLRKAQILKPPYQISLSSILIRGIELACAELEKKSQTK